MFDWLSRNWRRLLLPLTPIFMAYAALLVLEGVAISWIDRWLPVSTFESATWAALFVTAGLMWLRLCLIGLGVYLALRFEPKSMSNGWCFGTVWAVGSAAVALALLAPELGQHKLQYGGGSYSGETVRSILLSLIYVKILLAYPGVRLLLGSAPSQGDAGARCLSAAWHATTLMQSIRLFALLLVLKLIIESVLVTVLSYMPVVAPFWFIPDELSRLRYFVGQGTRVAAETLGVLLYVAFFIAADRRHDHHKTRSQD